MNESHYLTSLRFSEDTPKTIRPYLAPNGLPIIERYSTSFEAQESHLSLKSQPSHTSVLALGHKNARDVSGLMSPGRPQAKYPVSHYNLLSANLNDFPADQLPQQLRQTHYCNYYRC